MQISNWFQQVKKPSYWITVDSPKDSFYVGKFVFGTLILLLLYRWYAGKFLMDLAYSPVIDPEVDNTFWIFLATGISQSIINNPNLCIIIDLLVVISACIGFLRKDKVAATWIFLVLFLIQTLTIEAYTSSHSKTVICVIFTLLPFGFRGQYWLRLWELARYIIAFVLIHAACAKIYFGGLFTTDQMTNILIAQHTDIFVLAPDSLQTHFIQYLIAHPSFTNILYVLTVITQLSFITLFFTKRFDKIFSVFLVSFVAGTYVMMRIYNMDLFFMVYPLWFSSVYYSSMISQVSENSNRRSFFIFRSIRFSS